MDAGQALGNSQPKNKRGRYSHNRCSYCKEKKVKCTPELRNQPSGKCDYCEQMGLPCSAIEPFRSRKRQKKQPIPAQVTSDTGPQTSSKQVMQDCWLALSWCQMLNQIVIVARDIDQSLRAVARKHIPSVNKFLTDLESTRREVYSIFGDLIKETFASASNAELYQLSQALIQARLEDGERINHIILDELFTSRRIETHIHDGLIGPKLSIHDVYIMDWEGSQKDIPEIVESYENRLQDTWRSISDLWNRVGAHKLTKEDLMNPFIHEFYFTKGHSELFIIPLFIADEDSLGRTPLHFATSQLHFFCANFDYWDEIFESCDDSCSARDHFGRTPLHIACAADRPENYHYQLDFIETLLEADTDISIRDEYGLLAIEYAVINNRIDILEVFQKVRQVDLRDIFSAIDRGQKEINIARVKTQMKEADQLDLEPGESDSDTGGSGSDIQTEVSDSGE
ncbi:hypothetical protein F4679DRAFT_25028 [Xylaria curta]|nr:hypothetical protein F4679DRAFT_25028 [Xylaria curta]